MELTPIYKRVIGLDVHQAKISACVVAEQADGSVTVEQKELCGWISYPHPLTATRAAAEPVSQPPHHLRRTAMRTPATLLLLVLLLPAWAGATTYSYPNTRHPLFSMDIPDRWEVQVEGELLHTGPPDGSIYLGFWALDPDTTGDQVGAAAEEIVSSVVRNYTIEEEDNFESNGIPFYYFQGSGWEREGGGQLRFGVAMFSPNGHNVFAVFFFGAPQDEARHDKALQRIIRSIRRG
jgi:hypothetical protein